MWTTRLGEHFRSNVIGYICLAWLMTGTAFAVTKLPAKSVGPKQLRAGAVRTKALARNAVTGVKVAPDSLTGAQILESSLGQVPSAAKVGGAGESDLQRRVTGTCTADTAVTAVQTDGSVTCAGASPIKRVTAGTGLAGGGDHGEVTLGADLTTVQHRVNGGCTTAIQLVKQDGGVNCAVSGIDGLSETVAVNHGLNFGNFGDYSIGMSCGNSGFTRMLLFNETGGSATLNWIFSDGTTMHASGTSLANNTEALIDVNSGRLEGQFILAGANSVTTLQVHEFNFGSGCEIVGTTEKAGL